MPESSSASTAHRCRWSGCTAVYTNTADLYGHLRKKHTAIGTFPCNWEECCEVLQPTRGAASHFAVHAGDPNFACDSRPKRFRKVAHLASHRCTTVDEPEATASTVEPKTPTRESSSDDVEQDWSFAPVVPEYPPRFASPTLSEMSALTEPTSEHAFECRWRSCDASFDSAHNLLKHVCDQHARPSAMKCEWGSCKKRNTLYLTFIQHVKKHCPVQYICPVDTCDSVMGGQAALTLHMRKHNKSEESNKRAHPEPTDSARKKLKNDEDSPLPAKQPSELPPKSIHHCLWQNCTTFCTTTELLFDHLQSIHAKHTKMGCKWQFCNAMLNSRNATLHFSEHAGHKPFPCNWCSSAFTAAAGLAQHKRRHCKARPVASPFAAPNESDVEYDWTSVNHVCKWHTCTSVFERADELVDHLYNTHTLTGASYCAWEGCTEQDKAFKRLSKHSRKHIRLVLSCHTCGKIFADRTAMTRHVRQEHNASFQRPQHSRMHRSDSGSAKEQDDDSGRCDSDAGAFQAFTAIDTPSPACPPITTAAPRSPSSALSTLTEPDPEPSLEFTCRWTACDASFSTVDLLAQHLSDAHVCEDGARTARTCAWGACNRTITGLQNFIRHIKSHCKARLECPHPTCRRVCGDQSALTLHIRQTHATPASSKKRMRSALDGDDETETPLAKRNKKIDASAPASGSRLQHSERASSDTVVDHVLAETTVAVASHTTKVEMSSPERRSIITVEDVTGGMENRMLQHLNAEIERRVSDAVRRAMRNAIDRPTVSAAANSVHSVNSNWSERFIEGYNDLVEP